jgi:hypothetical protein
MFLQFSGSNLDLYEQQAEFGETIDHPANTSIITMFSMRYEARLKILLQIEHYQMAALGWR